MPLLLRHSAHLLAGIFLWLLIGREPLQAQTASKAPADSLPAPAPSPPAPLVQADDPSNNTTKAYADKIIMPSPDVASLGKYVDVPVNNYTGTPNISIPLYTIKTRDLELPLSINYHGSGIRVEEEASSIGLGWALIAGGVIQHSIRGRDDFIAGNFDANDWRALSTTVVQGSPAFCAYYQNTNAAYFIPSSQTGSGIQLNNTLAGLFSTNGNNGERGDSERDIFSFSFPGHSGKFVIEPLGSGLYTIRQMPQSDLRIVLNNNDLTGNSGFVITDTDGTRYTFGQQELRQSQQGAYESLRDTGKKYKATTTGLNPIWGNAATGFLPAVNSTGAWYLTQIQSQKGDIISFAYTVSTNWIDALPIRNESFTTSIVNTPRWHISETKTKLVYPQTITFANGTVTFSSDNREDLFTGAKRLTGLEVKASTGSTVRKYQFNQGYFNSGSGAETFVAKRLKLLSVQDVTGGNCVPPYIFSYEESVNLPNKDSYQQDYWGFYNGAIGNDNSSTGTPPLESQYGTDRTGTMLPPIVAGQFHLPFPGADRSPNATYMRANVLTKITYPTGGTAEFDFQPHVSNNLLYSPTQRHYIRVSNSIGNSIIGGGLRINSIVTTSQAGVTQTSTYDYGMTGKQMSNIQFADWVYYGPNNYQLQYSSSPQYPLGSGAQGNSVGYSSVVVYRGGPSQGQSVYSYTNEVEVKAADFCISTNLGTVSDGATCSPQPSQADPGLCDPYGMTQFSNYNGVNDASVPNYINPLNGSLTDEIHYASDGKMIKYVSNSYEVVNVIRIKNFRLMKRSNILSSFVYYTDSDWPRITKSIVNDYGGGASTTLFTSTTTTYGYNSTGAHKQITSLTTTDKSGEQVIISRTYPPDVSPATPMSNGLINLNMLSAQLKESESLLKPASSPVAVRSTRTNYSAYGSWMAPNTIESQVGGGPFVTDASFEYTTGGDVSAVTERDNIRTTFIYYSGSGKTALPQNRIVGANQPSAQTTTYDYLPLVGLSSTTDPKGMVTNYAYDSYNRLKVIRDSDSNLLKTFDYNYASSGCTTRQLGLFPDLTPIIYARPFVLRGTSNLTLIVDLVELNSRPTNGQITIRINKNAQINFTFDAAVTSVGDRSVQNNVWNFDGSSNTNYYVLTTNQPIPAGGVLTLGLNGILTPGATSGLLTISALLEGGSGSETTISNNTDSDRIDYYQN